MSRYHLSVLIPARNEYYHDIDLLYETVTNVLANTSDKTEIIAVLDGYSDSWPKQPLPSNSRLTVIHHRKSIGQRAATNEAARVATGEYVMKLDAHCALDENFDEKLLADFKPDWTVVPGQYNLLVFEWKCKRCDWTRDQSPKPAKCEKCGSRYLKQVKVWKPRDGKQGRRRAYTHAWRFDSTLTFQYWGAYASDETYCKKHGVPFRPETQQPIHDTMCLLGACWAMTRKRYFEIEPCDERMGSWGQQGLEVCLKTHLSGGELKVNQNTWFAHFFRTGGIQFPYPDGGRKERAVARSKELWLENKWDKQVRPLSWVLEKFKPVPDWHTNDNPLLAQVLKAGKAFKSSVPSLGFVQADTTDPERGSVREVSHFSGQRVPVDTVGLSSVDGGDGVGSSQVIDLQDQSQMSRIAARGVITNDVVQQGNVGTEAKRDRTNQPSVHQPREPKCFIRDSQTTSKSGETNLSITIPVSASIPDPAAPNGVNGNLREQPSDKLDVKFGNSEILLGSHDSASDAGLRSGSEPRLQRDSDPSILPRKPRFTALYYSCNSHDETLELAARANLRRATNGHEIGCVALKRTDFGDWTIVLDRQRSPETMHHQILAGLERSTADYVFLCESDVMYSPTHFEFTPPDDETFYYNTNVWRVRWEDGHAVRTANLQQVSGICANRQLLLRHYRRRIEVIEQGGGRFDTKRMAYEPGTRGKFGDEKIANWSSPYPNLDITGHGNTLTTPHFSVESFRNKKFAEGWQETDGQIDGWPLIYGRVQDWLKEMIDESVLR